MRLSTRYAGSATLLAHSTVLTRLSVCGAQVVDDADAIHDKVYMGSKKLRSLKSTKHSKARQYMEAPVQNETMYMDVEPVPYFAYRDVSLWVLVNDVLSAAREVIKLHTTMAKATGGLQKNR